jgi:hypothetical protein
MAPFLSLFIVLVSAADGFIDGIQRFAARGSLRENLIGGRLQPVVSMGLDDAADLPSINDSLASRFPSPSHPDGPNVLQLLINAGAESSKKMDAINKDLGDKIVDGNKVLSDKIDTVASELRASIKALDEKIVSSNDELRKELRASIKALDEKIDTVAKEQRKELDVKIDTAASELRASIKALSDKVDTVASELRASIKALDEKVVNSNNELSKELRTSVKALDDEIVNGNKQLMAAIVVLGFIIITKDPATTSSVIGALPK